MKYNQIREFGMDTIGKHRRFPISVSIILIVLVLQIFLSGSAPAVTTAVPLPPAKANAVTGRFGSVNLPRPVRVGLYENKPKIYTDATGEAAGIFPVILEEIARKEKWQLTYVPCEWFACLEALENGSIDLMPDVAFSPKRDEQFDFHGEEVVGSWSAIYANSKRQMDKIADLDGRRIAVLKGSIQQTTLEQMARGFGFTVTFVETNSFDEAYSLTAEGSADAVVSNHFYGDHLYQRYGLKKTPIVFNPVSLYFATTSGANADLLSAIDDDLRAMKSDPGSIYYKELVRWMEKPTLEIVPPYLVWIIGGISGLLAVAVAFILMLRWQVRVATRDLAQANEKLHDSEKMFRDLFHQHAAAKLLIDPDTGNIVEANAAAGKFYGWSREQLRQMRVQDINIISPEQAPTEMVKAGNQRRVHFEFRHRLADGSVRDVVVFSSKLVIQGRPLLHSIIHDISERRSLEEQLRQAQKMEAVGRLAGGVAHDYNNMLSVILGHTELAMSKMAPADPLRDHLKEVLNAARRSTDITRQLLAFARKQAVTPKVIDLNAAVAEMLKMLRWLIGENIELAWLPATRVWPIKIDPTQIDQILANLCLNARDAISDMGKITIETDTATFDNTFCAAHAGFVAGQFVMLCVSDNGCGMDEEMLDHAFEPFYTTKSLGEGTGLGLATVYGIVKQNNGFIKVHSKPGRGTTFRLYFPRYEGKLDEQFVEGPAPISRGGGEMILLVEDDQAIRQMSKELLENLGYKVLEAHAPNEALRLAEEHAGAIDLLVTDVIMPEMDGRDLANRLRTRQPKLKILFMSGFTADIITPEKGLDAAVHFMQKPFTRKDLAVKVRESLDERGD